MDSSLAELLATKTIILLFEANSNQSQLARVKNLIDLFINTRNLPHDELILSKVNRDAVLLRSQKILEKGFPLVYLIQRRKFIGLSELDAVLNSGHELNLPLVDYNDQKDEIIEALKSFFRGCVILRDSVKSFGDISCNSSSPNINNNNNNNNNNSNSNVTGTISTSPAASPVLASDPISLLETSTLDPGYTSQMIENALWATKWGFNQLYTISSSVYNYYYPDQSNMSDQTGFGTPLSDPQNFEDRDYIDFTTLRCNWYGRYQKRIYRFYRDRFQRIDPVGDVTTGRELVKATYRYEDIDRITIENNRDLVIWFRDPKTNHTQYIHSPEASKIITLITSRTRAKIRVFRNLSVKFERHPNLYTMALKISPNKIVGNQLRWSKDGSYIAFEDEIGYKAIPLESIGELTTEYWWAHDLFHFATRYVENQPIGQRLVAKIPSQQYSVITKEVLDEHYESVTHDIILYRADMAKGTRTEKAGLVFEMLDAIGNSSLLFTAKSSEFNQLWKRKDLNLHLYDCKGGVPYPSPDGQFVAYVEPDTNSIVIHKVGEFSNELSEQHEKILSSNGFDIEEILYNPFKPLPKNTTKNQNNSVNDNNNNSNDNNTRPTTPIIPSSIPTSMHLKAVRQ